MRHLIVFGGLIVLVLTAVAALHLWYRRKSAGRESAGCKSTGDCPAGQICASGSCVTPKASGCYTWLPWDPAKSPAPPSAWVSGDSGRLRGYPAAAQNAAGEWLYGRALVNNPSWPDGTFFTPGPPPDYKTMVRTPFTGALWGISMQNALPACAKEVVFTTTETAAEALAGPVAEAPRPCWDSNRNTSMSGSLLRLPSSAAGVCPANVCPAGVCPAGVSPVVSPGYYTYIRAATPKP